MTRARHEAAEEIGAGASQPLNAALVSRPGDAADPDAFRSLVEDSLQGIIVYDEGGGPLFVNHAAARMFGYADSGELLAFDSLEVLAAPEGLAAIREVRRRLFAAEVASASFEWPGRRKDGTPLWLETRSRRIDWDGIPAVQAAIIDITSRKQAEQELAARHAFDRVLSDLSAKFLQMAPEAVADGIAAGLQEVCHWLGIDRCTLYECAEDGETLLQVHSYAAKGDSREVPRNLNEELPWFAARLLQGRTMVTAGPIDLPPTAEAERSYSRAQRIRSSVSIPISIAGAPVCALVATAIDAAREWPEDAVEQLRLLAEIFAGALTRRRDDQAIRQSEDRFRDLTEISADWFWEVDEAMRFTYVSDRLVKGMGATRAALLGRTPEEVIGVDPDDPHWRRQRARRAAREPFRDFRFRYVDGDGGEHFLSISGKPIFDADGRFRGYRGVGRNITRSVLAETVLKESADRVRDFAEATSDWFWETDAAHRTTYISGSVKGWDDISIEDQIGHSRFEFEAFDGEPEKWQRHREDLEARRPFRDFRYKRQRQDGSVQHISASGRPYFGLDGTFLGYRGTGIDVTAEIEARTQLSDAIESMTDGVVIYDKEDRLVICNRAFMDLHAAIAEQIRPGTRFREILELVTDNQMVANAIGREEEWIQERLLFFGRAKGVTEFQLDDGRWIQVADRRTKNGYTVGLRTDVTLSKQREDQLRQAQKMEAIGQLTGGVAHDFNNLLAIIQGNIAFLEKQLDEDSPYRRLTEPALRATNRGAALTHRLLAFSRRQPLEDQVVDVGELVRGMQDLLHRSLGEDIALEIVPEADLWSCVVDPTQLEQAILNLAINARDAMADGGRLLIEAANAELTDAYAAAQAEVRPGEYVMVAVSDSGHGMSPEVASRIFEPFFTTKEIGKGTGLGLSMVFGFAKQSNGHITVYSEPGLGSTFKLYLPRSSGVPVALASADEDGELPPKGAGQHVLLVEDDADVRKMAAMLLRTLDYRVAEAEDAEGAMRVLRTDGPIDLLLTDVVLPGGMDGHRLAAKARRHCPGLKVLYMSGHTRDVMLRDGHLESDANLLRKPFEPRDLARMVAAAMAKADASPVGT